MVASKNDPETEATLCPVRESAAGLQQPLVRVYGGIESATMSNLPTEPATKDVLPNNPFKTPLLG